MSRGCTVYKSLAYVRETKTDNTCICFTVNGTRYYGFVKIFVEVAVHRIAIVHQYETVTPECVIFDEHDSHDLAAHIMELKNPVCVAIPCASIKNKLIVVCSQPLIVSKFPSKYETS